METKQAHQPNEYPGHGNKVEQTLHKSVSKETGSSTENVYPEEEDGKKGSSSHEEKDITV
jgi:hypothetical protein